MHQTQLWFRPSLARVGEAMASSARSETRHPTFGYRPQSHCVPLATVFDGGLGFDITER